MPVPATVRTRILEAFKAHLEDNVAALDFGIRHARHREATEAEWPCVSIRYVSRDVAGTSSAAGSDAAGLSNSEEAMTLQVDLIAECALPSEKSGNDPTGWEGPGLMLERCMDTLFAEGLQPESLGGLLSNITFDGDAAGDDEGISQPDSARLAERLTLVYRARTEYPIGILDGS